MASTPSKTLLECKGFSGEAGGNGQAERIRISMCCIWSIHSSATGTKREGTDPSVNTWISDGGREDSPLEAIWCRDVLLPEQSGMKRETLKWVVDHGEKGNT